MKINNVVTDVVNDVTYSRKSVNTRRGRALTNVERTCGSTPLLYIYMYRKGNKICLTSRVVITLLLHDGIHWKTATSYDKHFY